MTDKFEWQTNLVRLSFFPPPDFEMNENWWQELTDEIPEVENTNRRTGTHQFEGEHKDGKLILRIQPVRIDWLYLAVDKPEISEPASLGEFEQSTEYFTKLIKQWINTTPVEKFNRIAFGAVVYHTIENVFDGYQLLENKFLQMKPNFDENTSDFLFHINRKRQSNILEDLTINRLSKWSVATFQKLQFAPAPVALPESYALWLELDINSSQHWQGDLSLKNAEDLVEEFLSLGYEVSQEGDIS